jgi:hypothetical protein
MIGDSLARSGRSWVRPDDHVRFDGMRLEILRAIRLPDFSRALDSLQRMDLSRAGGSYVGSSTVTSHSRCIRHRASTDNDPRPFARRVTQHNTRLGNRSSRHDDSKTGKECVEPSLTHAVLSSHSTRRITWCLLNASRPVLTKGPTIISAPPPSRLRVKMR